MRWLANLVVPLAFVLASCGMGVANANTLGGARETEFYATNPGFAAVSRHPVLVALLLWALVHLVVNGDLAHAIVFGSFAAFPLLAMWVFDKTAARLLGAKSAELFSHSAWLSLAPLCNTGWWRKYLRALSLRCAIGLICWLAALHLHAAVIGVWPFP